MLDLAGFGPIQLDHKLFSQGGIFLLTGLKLPGMIGSVMAIVKNGEVVKVEKTDDLNDSVKCDRCGRPFPIKYRICVCRG